MNKKNIAYSFVALLALTLVSAGLITYYGSVEQNVNVEQGLSIDGQSWDIPLVRTMDTTSIQNSVFMSAHSLENEANVDASVTLNTTCDGAGSCEEISREHYKTNLMGGELNLSLKNVDWTQITDDNDVIVEYHTTTSGALKIDSITGLPDSYILVYYADEEFDSEGNRLVTPGQAYPLADGDYISVSSNDGNLKDNYCDSDSYDHCRGIKLWAVKNANLNVNDIDWSSDWQSTSYFETDMLGWNHLDEELTNPFDVSAMSELDFVIVSEFPVGTFPGDYTLTTTVDLA